MGDNPLLCNVGQCRRPIGDRAWVTRCLHVFCSDHGMAHFGSENAAQVACPACNEINVKETDVVHCDLNPHDMILFGLPPQKAIRMAVKSLKLWWYQMEQEREFGAARYEKLNKKISEVKSAYERVLNQLEMKLQSEIDGLKNCYKEALEREKRLHEELEEARDSLRKYQVAYNSIVINKKREQRYPDWTGGSGPKMDRSPIRTPSDWRQPPQPTPAHFQPQQSTSVAYSPPEMTSRYFKKHADESVGLAFWDRFSI